MVSVFFIILILQLSDQGPANYITLTIHLVGTCNYGLKHTFALENYTVGMGCVLLVKVGEGLYMCWLRECGKALKCLYKAKTGSDRNP
jgi:hypothetical protein